MDSSIYVWNVWSTEQKKARAFNFHTAAVKDIEWSEQSLSLLSCGYDCSSRLIDVEKGLETHVFKEDQIVGAIKFHPNNSNLFLSGGSKGVIQLWDIRTGNAVNRFFRGLGPILDLEFTNDTRQFISSSDESKSNISENAIIVWDVSRQIPLSNQVIALLIFIDFEWLSNMLILPPVNIDVFFRAWLMYYYFSPSHLHFSEVNHICLIETYTVTRGTCKINTLHGLATSKRTSIIETDT